MKKLCAALAFIFLILCMSVYTGAYADSDGRPTPWEDSGLKVCVAETFSEFEDADIDLMESYLWFSPDYAAATKWEDGRYVITDSPMIERYAFRIASEAMGQALTQEEQDGALGMGFYIENNTSQDFYAGPYMVGTSANAVVAQGRPLYLVGLDGNITKAEDSEGMGMALIPSGFRGHIVFFKEDLTGAGGTGDIPAGNYIGYPGFELVYSSVDASKNESIVLDNVFFFGYDFEDSLRELIDQPVQSDYPVPSPNQTDAASTPEPSSAGQPGQSEQPEQPEQTATSGAQLENSSSAAIDTPNGSGGNARPSYEPEQLQSDGGLIWYILGAAAILCAAAAVIIIMVRKNKAKPQK